MFIFLLMNSIVGVSAFLLTYRILKFNNFIDSLISIFIIYFAQIIFTELLLGVLGVLYLNNVVLLNLAILLLVWLTVRNKPSFFCTGGIKESILELSKNKIILLGISIIVSFGLVKSYVNLINPPFGWDSLNYHFTFPVEWLKHGNLNIPVTVFDDPSPSYYPINGSLFFLWLMLPLKSVLLADLGQIPFFILAFLATYNISRKIGLNKELSFYAGSLFLLIPNFFKQLQIAYVDVMVASLFLVCVNFLFLLNEKFYRSSLLVYSISLGLLLGTKTLSLPYCILLLVPFIYLRFKNINKPHLFIFLILSIIIFGGFSYIRNFFDTGNPLYPLNFRLFGKTIFRGVMDSSVYRAHFKIDDYRISKLLFHEGLGIQSTIFILPAIFLALPRAFIKKRKELTFNLIYFLILPMLIYLVYRYIIPLANTRYLYPLLGIGMASGFYVAKILEIPRIIIGILVTISYLASMSELAKRQELVISIVSAILLFLILSFFMRFIKGLIKKSFFIALFIFITLGLIFLNRDYNANEYPRYIKMVKYSGFWPEATKAWDWLNKNTYGDNIAYAGRPVPFPLYGSNFKNNVYYVSVNKTEPAKLHYFPKSHYCWDYDFLSLHKNLEAEGNYRGAADYSVWIENLSKRKINYLFIYSLHQTKDIIFPIEDNWARANPNKFNSVFNNSIIHIYRILQ